MTYNQDVNKFYVCKEIIRKNKLTQKDYRKLAHKSFVKENRGWFWFFDIAIVLLLLFNYGAHALTNILLMSNPEMNLYEANAAQAFVNEYEVHEAAQAQYIGFYFQMVVWALILFGYLFYRTHVFEYNDFYLLAFFMVAYLFTMSFDFVNNFGYFIGKIIFGV